MPATQLPVSSTEEKIFEDLTRSNKGIIPETLQKKAWQTRIAVLGCGIGSAIVYAAVCHGFRKFLITDPDRFEPSNGNRQFMDFKDGLKNLKKVDVVKRKAQTINPLAEIETFPEGTTNQSIPYLVGNADYIIDAMDPFQAFEQSCAVQEEAAKQGKYVLVPLELADRGAVYVFGPTTISYRDFILDTTEDTSLFWDPSNKDSIITKNLTRVASPLAKDLGTAYMQGKLEKYPQVSGTTNIIAARIIRILFQLMDKDFLSHKQPVVLAPEASIIEW